MLHLNKNKKRNNGKKKKSNSGHKYLVENCDKEQQQQLNFNFTYLQLESTGPQVASASLGGPGNKEDLRQKRNSNFWARNENTESFGTLL